MKGVDWLWPKQNQRIWDIKDQNYLVNIQWSKRPFSDYMKLSEQYAHCGYCVFKEIIERGHDNSKSDIWFLPSVYLLRQSIELALKALICRIYDKKHDVQNVFENCSHNLVDLYEHYKLSNEDYLTAEEKNWLTIYLTSVELVDEKSDLFRFPFEDEFLEQYHDKFLDNFDIANNLIQCYSLIKKCINKGTYDDNRGFDNSYDPQFLLLANHGIGNCYLWEPISDHGFHTKIHGYGKVADFIFYECNELTNEEKAYPLMFLLRNLIELSLKRLFFIRVEHGIPKQIFMSKRRSHLIEKDLWRNAKPMIEYYAEAREEDKSIISIVEGQLKEISSIDKNGDMFRYPTSYSFEYKFNNRTIDLKNIFEHMKAISNFLDGCDGMLDEIAEYEAEMMAEYQAEMASYMDW